MGEESKLRCQQYRVNKLRDDQLNRSTEVNHRIQKLQRRREEKESASQVPFYERLRHHSETFDGTLRRKDLENKQQASYKAAHIEGICLIDSGKIDEHQRIDG